MSAPLVSWLATLDSEGLALILANRPDVVAAPAPRSLGELADRLTAPYSVAGVLTALPLPDVQVLEAAAVLDDGVPPGALAALLGVADDDPALRQTLTRLSEAGLAWPHDDHLHFVDADHVWPCPLDLGGPLEPVLAQRTVRELKDIADTLGLPVNRLKRDLVADLVDWLGDPDNVGPLVATAPEKIRAILRRAAWQEPYLHSPQVTYGHHNSPLKWALARGLLVRLDWETVHMPAEVALALRGPDYRAPFNPVPPPITLVEVSADRSNQDTAAAAHLVGSVTALLEECAHRPLAVLKSGGIGARELKRLAKGLSGSVEHARFWLELAHVTGLVATTATGVVTPTGRYDLWVALEPADRLTELLLAWPELRCAPLYTPPADEPVRPTLKPAEDGGLVVTFRSGLLDALNVLPAGHGAADPDTVVATAAWNRAIVASVLDDVSALGAALWSEAELLGIVTMGAFTDLGRAVAAQDSIALASAAGLLLPAAETRALFQADLTAVVPGAPSGMLAALLDSVAARESRSSASVWRFTADSVRRALDAGHTAEDLTAGLQAHATARLPQALEYLITDVARRHGAVRVRPVASCLLVDDPALLAEIVHTKGLSTLGLTALAPTVAASTASADETLKALRKAGYAPVGQNPDGTVTVERAVRHRAAPVPTPGPGQRQTAPAPLHVRGSDLNELAAILLAAGPGTLPHATHTGTPEQIAALTRSLSAAEVRLLAYSIDEGVPVRIDYINVQGNRSRRVIEEVQHQSGAILAWCRLRNAERMFTLSRIIAVAPA